MRNTCKAGKHARREGKKEEEREKEEKRRLSALGSQDPLSRLDEWALASMRVPSCSSISEEHSREGRCSLVMIAQVTGAYISQSRKK